MMITVYLSRKDGCSATAVYNTETKECTVKKGSIVSEAVSEGTTFRSAKSVQKMRIGTIVDSIVQCDVTFKSASTAANYITGKSTNGLLAWRDENGRTLHTLNDAEV